MRTIRLIIAGLALAGGLAAASCASAMSFQRTTEARDCQARVCVLASGPIEAGSEDEFGRFLRRERIAPGAVVILDSDGGDVLAALRMGARIRQEGLDTEVQAKGAAVAEGHCASACVYIFMGGLSRSVAPEARIGVHQMYGRHVDLSSTDSQALTALIAVHLKRCGGGMDLLISALRTPPERMHWLSPLELHRFQVITGQVAADRSS